MAGLSYTTSNSWYNVDFAPYILEPAEKLKEIAQPEDLAYANSPFLIDFYYYSNTNMPRVRYFKEAGRYYLYNARYNPETGEFDRLPGIQYAIGLGTKYIVWLKAFQPQNFADRVPKEAELIVDERTYAFWRVPENLP